MRNFKLWLVGLLALVLVLPLEGRNPDHEAPRPKPTQDNAVSYRSDCNTAQRQIDQGINRLTGGFINNVRARLLTGGDVWWDRDDGRYIVPIPSPGSPEVSSIFSGAVWLGGLDPGGGLKVAGQTYGNAQGLSDFWPGPLEPNEGTTSEEICQDWDRFFEVYASEIDQHLRNLAEAEASGIPYDPNDIPRGVKGWPSRGNEYFFEINEFELPATDQGLAGFFDRNGNNIYEPLDGDYPVIEIRGCPAPQYPDQMIFWIYNDNGNIHGESLAAAIQMEVQVQAFSYGTNDAINDMTFQRYKMINRAIEDIDSCFFAIFVDADLGCFTDDYIGCDTSRSLAYTYNADAEDGDVGITCPGGVQTYGTDIPVVGIDYFRGPLKPFFNSEGNIDTLIELGMSSFTYFNNPGTGNPDPNTTDPSNDIQFYNYLSGSWRDGSPFTYGGNAYGGLEPIDYAFTEPPNDPAGWSMCTQDLPEYDRRTVQASGPFTLTPGAVNELIIGVVWVPSMVYPCPDLTRFFQADDLAQNLFDNCFDITDGPDAPDVCIIELDRQLILTLTNDTLFSNNAYEEYEELDLLAPLVPGLDTTYNFEGYLVYQLANEDVSVSDLGVDPSKARLIYQVDVKNGISELYNWVSTPAPGGDGVIWYPEIKVQGADNGIQHTFVVRDDQFASGDRRLVNHKKYYFRVLAYAYNNYADYDPVLDFGQKSQYLVGRRNAIAYTGIPRPIVDRNLNAAYGDGPTITRIDGVGVGGNFVDITAETRERIMKGEFDGEIDYVAGRGPINVQVYNPLDIVDGQFELTFVDSNNNDDELEEDTRWVLRNLTDPSRPDITSEKSIARLNEDILAQYGFTISIGQTPNVGDDREGTNGAIGYEEEYLDDTKPFWFSGVSDGLFSASELNFVATGPGEPDNNLDPRQRLTNVGPGTFVPFQLLDYRDRPDNEYITPGWRNSQGNQVRDASLLASVNNIDIVFTSDKSLWSRSVVVETANRYYPDLFGFPTDGDRNQFDLRAQPSVSKEADANGNPIPDGAVDNQGNPRVGMGWFPGYAIDVETGKRLNIFFGENSAYDCSILCEEYLNQQSTTQDLVFNPTSQLFLNTGLFANVISYIGGGQHFIYVTNTEYDSCEGLYNALRNPSQIVQRFLALRSITWAGWPLMTEGTEMQSYADGLIPNDLIVKLRVDNSYKVAEGTGDFNGNPTYRFEFDGAAPTPLDELGIESALDMINVVPNPYYGFSEYEIDQFSTTVKITNLPAKCVITIYSLDGKYIRQYNRDEQEMPTSGNKGTLTKQYLPDVEWDLKNTRGIPVAGGVYLIHVDAGELGQRVIKWFGTNRQFDPAGL